MRSALQPLPPEGKKRRGTGLALIVTLVFGLLVLVAVGAGLWSATADQETSPAPTELAGYRLVWSVVGPQAIAEVNSLHGTDIDIVDAWIGHYQEGGAVWVAQATSEAKAREMLDEMVLRIKDGGSPFRGLTRREFQGMPLYSVRDARQAHFFYQSGVQVVWLATPPGAEEAFLAKALDEVS